HAQHGSALHYDRLVLATGAEAIMPHMQVEMRRNGAIDAELSMRARREAEASGDPRDRYPDGVMALRTMEDATTIRAAVEAGEPVVVLGGGVLGVEAALAVAEIGAPVTLVHRGTAPMGRQIDADSGQLLRRELVGAGVDVRSSTDIHTIVSDDGRLTAVRTSRDEKLPARLLVTCCGVLPRHELALDAGLPTNGACTSTATAAASATSGSTRSATVRPTRVATRPDSSHRAGSRPSSPPSRCAATWGSPSTSSATPPGARWNGTGRRTTAPTSTPRPRRPRRSRAWRSS
ncbi:FAD-dependent oxidoreductase, partial [Nesterenkonia sp. F]|uniref:FAD-dependent oxidoreductase n=1 Tax=Nesterenkonia sp. F TaxID=795955 RepID=UPI000255CE6E